jgi:hypothetical protein
MSLDKKPLQYAIYKGVRGNFGAVQFNFQRPHYYKATDTKDKDYNGIKALDGSGKLQDGWRQREGAVFIEATSAVGNNQYDWDQKITFACSINDMGRLILALTTGDPLDLMHDPGAKTEREGDTRKHVKLFSKGNPVKTGCIMTVTESSGKVEKEHKVPLSADECVVLRQLFLTACSKALDW